MDYRRRQRELRLRELCSRFVYPWLVSLGGYAKDNGIYPLSLSDFYADPRDKEIAAVVEAVLPLSRRESYITEVKNLLGSGLHERVLHRDFMDFSKNDMILSAMNFRTSQVYNILDWIWSAIVVDRIPLEYAVLGELDIIKRQHSEPLADVMDFTDQHLRLERVLAKMTLKGGYGCGQWDFLEESELPCPWSVEIRKMLKSYCPIPFMSENDMADFVGLPRRIDALYVYWGHEWLAQRHGTELEKFQRKLRRWYEPSKLRYDLRVPEELMVKKNPPQVRRDV